MIEHQTIDGEPVTVVYIDENFVPVAADDAALVKVLYANGDVAFMRSAAVEELLNTGSET